jgi:hypothetical protein
MGARNSSVIISPTLTGCRFVIFMASLTVPKTLNQALRELSDLFHTQNLDNQRVINTLCGFHASNSFRKTALFS